MGKRIEKYQVGTVTHFKVMVELRKIRGQEFEIYKWFEENGHHRNISPRRRVPTPENLDLFNKAKTPAEIGDALLKIHSQKSSYVAETQGESQIKEENDQEEIDKKEIDQEEIDKKE